MMFRLLKGKPQLPGSESYFYCLFKPQLDMAVRISDIRQMKMRCLNGHDIGMGQFTSLVKQNFPVGFKLVEEEKVWQVLRAAIEMEFCRQKDVQVDEISSLIFLYNKLTVAFVNGLIFAQERWELRSSKKLSQLRR